MCAKWKGARASRRALRRVRVRDYGTEVRARPLHPSIQPQRPATPRRRSIPFRELLMPLLSPQSARRSVSARQFRDYHNTRVRHR